MKTGKLWTVLTVVMIFIGAGLIDKSVLFANGYLSHGKSDLAARKATYLMECGERYADVDESLIPDQKAAVKDKLLTSIKPSDFIPENRWSSRAGFSIALRTDAKYWAYLLGAGWYLDWAIETKPISNIIHWQMVRVHEDCISPSVEEIQSAAKNFPGQVWIIGNEPDVIWQDNVTAKTYAVVYHKLYKIIKAADPTASIAVGGVSQATSLRLRYLDQMLTSYQIMYHEKIPVDWWTVHGYVLREEKGSWGVDIPPGIDVTQGDMREVKDHGRIDLFRDQISAFRKWMAENGYQNTPLALTEFGILMPEAYGFSSEMVADYLQQTFTWLFENKDVSVGYPQDEYRLVQKWAWFSIADDNYVGSDLGDIYSGELTQVGEQFRRVVSTIGQ